MINFFKNYIFAIHIIVLFLVNEVISLKKFFNIFFLIKNITFFQFITSKFENKKIFQLRDYNKYIELNSKLNDLKRISIISKEKIVIESLISHPLYLIPNCIIGNELKNFYKIDCIGLIKKGDIYSKEIIKSFGIKNIFELDNGNFFQRFFFFIKAIKIIKFNKSINWLIKYKYKEIEIGKSVYEHYIRFCKIGDPKLIDFKFYYFFSIALFTNQQCRNFLSKYKIKYWVQSESQYLPHRIFFQNVLLKKICIFARSGINNISVKKYSSFYEKNTHRYTISKNLINNVFKKYHKKILKVNKKKILKFVKNKIGHEIYQTFNNKKHLKLFKTKEFFLNYFNFKKRKPVVLILAHEYTDGNFNHNWNIFNNHEEYLIKTIKRVINIKNVNWIIKSHPSENIFNAKTNTKNLFNNLIDNKVKNIKLFPNEYSAKNVYKFINAVVTSHGSASYEYPTLGIPTITCGETFCSNLGINLESKRLIDYYKILNNIEKIKPLNLFKINKSILFIFIVEKLCKINIPQIYSSDISFKYNIKTFWKKTFNLLNRNPCNKKFNHFFYLQLKKGGKQLLNYDIIKKYN